MLKFINCIIYLIVIGIVSFIIGRIIPKKSLHWDRAPWRDFSFEKKGLLYEKLQISKWQSKMPDMSRLFFMIMPKKKLPSIPTINNIQVMLQETCMAELIHWLLAVFSFGCIFFWPGIGGLIISFVAFTGNMIFVIIQRYNRPRLVQLRQLLELREERRNK